MINMHIVSGLLVVLTMASLPVCAQSGRQTVQELYVTFSALSKNNRGVFDEAATKIDYATMAEMSFTPAQWDQFAPAQKREFIKVFRALIEERYYKRWQRLFLHSQMTVISEGKVAGDWYVKTSLVDVGDDADDTDTVIWRLRSSRGGDPMVISLNVNGKDLLTRLQGRFRKAFAKKGPVGVIAWMKDKADFEEEPEFAYSNKPQTAAR